MRHLNLNLTIIDGPGKILVAQMRQLFENTIRDTPSLAKRLKSDALERDGVFLGYADPDTDRVWVGFAIGLRCGDRINEANQWDRVQRGGAR